MKMHFTITGTLVFSFAVACLESVASKQTFDGREAGSAAYEVNIPSLALNRLRRQAYIYRTTDDDRDSSSESDGGESDGYQRTIVGNTSVSIRLAEGLLLLQVGRGGPVPVCWDSILWWKCRNVGQCSAWYDVERTRQACAAKGMLLHKTRGERWQHARLASGRRPLRALVRVGGSLQFVHFWQRAKWECRSLVKVLCRIRPPMKAKPTVTSTTRKSLADTTDAPLTTKQTTVSITPTAAESGKTQSVSNFYTSVHSSPPIKHSRTTISDRTVPSLVRTSEHKITRSVFYERQTPPVTTRYLPLRTPLSRASSQAPVTSTNIRALMTTSQALLFATMRMATGASNRLPGAISNSKVINLLADRNTNSTGDPAALENAADRSSWICDPRSIALLVLLAIMAALVCSILLYGRWRYHKLRKQLPPSRAKRLSAHDYAALESAKARSSSSTPHTQVSTFTYDYNLALPVDALTGADGYDIPTTLKMRPRNEGVHSLPNMNNIQVSGRFTADYINFKNSTARRKPTVNDSTNDYMEPVD